MRVKSAIGVSHEEGHELRAERGLAGGRALRSARANERGHRGEECLGAVDRDYRPDRLFDSSGQEPLQRGRHCVDEVVHAQHGPHVGFREKEEGQ